MVQIMGSARAYSHKSLMFPDRLTRKAQRNQNLFEGAIQLSSAKCLILQAESMKSRRTPRISRLTTQVMKPTFLA